MGKCLVTWKRLCLCLNPGTALEHSPATTQSALTSLAYSGRMFLLGQGPGEPPTSPGWKADALSLPPLEEGGCLYLDGKARRLLGTAGVTVCLATEGDSGWGFWAEIQVVVNKLAPLHEHEGSLLVHLEPLRREADDLVGHLSDLQGWRQNTLVGNDLYERVHPAAGSSAKISKALLVLCRQKPPNLSAQEGVTITECPSLITALLWL